MEELPVWEDGTVAILSTAAGAPHGIPISTAVRAGPRTLYLALALRRESLARLRRDPRVALTLLAHDVACTVHGTATVVEAPMAESDRVAAVRLDVEALQDHRQPRFALQEGVRWEWTDPEAAARDGEIRAGLRRIGREGGGGPAASRRPT
jgi:nitroimidazol reductase NimA-like FMN-containing flavoprotein (pyridoxamine 5'-phosphate oxidase superfamily)